ncbi:hypothetical protein ACHAWF_007991 [Thalassiosira exigua]
MNLIWRQVILSVVAVATPAASFSPNSSSPCCLRPASKLSSLIKGEAFGQDPFDENEGGVGLAQRTAIKISGSCREAKGTGAKELLRYDRMQELDVKVAKSIMEKANCQLLCSGTGRELYQDPGSSNRVEDKVVKLAPIEAAKDALASMASAVTIGEDAKAVVLNFLGGSELIVGEVLEACNLMVEGLDFPLKTKVEFNSVSFEQIPADICSVTVVASSGRTGGLEGVDESVARGEVYIENEKWLTVAEADLTTASN